ncbi:unnamed protein product [Lupinus luteus]|uniref:Amino acid transporter transmembrane domain-containing protein n=1 Tax=Lupinus luteus TaxID=3873 RepID=A0AAV1WBP6_LUPLU
MDVEGRATNNKSPTLNFEQDQQKGGQNDHVDLSSAHTIDHGWKWGIICLIIVGLYTAYVNWLLAAFHIIGDQRFIRYRDLMGFAYGKNMYRITWTLQFFTLLLGNMGFILMGGKALKNKDFDVSGSQVSKVFNAFGAISAVIVSNTSGLLPEIQSTLRKPPVKNMRKALYSQYTVGVLFYYGVTIMGYWAYGSMVSAYLPQNLSGPRWINVLINAVVFLQSITSQHMFVAPIHEALDTKFLDISKGMHSGENLKRLFLLRAIFFSGNTLVSAAFPFMGDFVNLSGSFSLVPLTFMFPSMVFIKVKGKTARIEKKAWHWFTIIFSSLLTIATTISAFRLIVDNIKKYHIFADA